MVAVLAIGFVLMAGYMYHLSGNTEAEGRSRTRYGANWPLSQAAVEVGRLATLAVAYGLAPSQAAREEMEQTLDVVASRAQLLHASPVFRWLREGDADADEIGHIVAALNDMVRRGEALVAGPPDSQALGAFAVGLGRLASRIAQLAART
ncbi:MAG: hypothetical protein WCP77_16565, partial [Roseococcus sp.]